MKIAVLGAGPAGLAAAYDLNNAGHEIVIFESGKEVGGLASGFSIDSWDWSVEKYYHHWFSTDDDMLGWLEELGLSDKVIFKNPTTSYFDADGNFALDKPIFKSELLSRMANVLSIPGLTLLAKLRFGAAAFLISLIKDGTFLEKHLADEWMRKVSGRKAYDRIWKPMLIGKFKGHYERVNMAWFWARLNKRTASLGTYHGGFQQALNDIATILISNGVDINLNAPVTHIIKTNEGIDITTNGSVKNFDKVLATFNPAVLAKITPDLPPEYSENLQSLKSMSALVFVLRLESQLMTDGTYWLNLPALSPDSDKNPFPFLALVEHTNYLSPDNFGGDHIVYLGDYVSPDHIHLKMDPADLLDKFLPSLERINSEFHLGWIKDWWLFKAPYAQPVPMMNHSEAIPGIKTPLDGLYCVSMSQVYPWDRGTNYAVEIGRRAARIIQEDR